MMIFDLILAMDIEPVTGMGVTEAGLLAVAI